MAVVCINTVINSVIVFTYRTVNHKPCSKLSAFSSKGPDWSSHILASWKLSHGTFQRWQANPANPPSILLQVFSILTLQLLFTFSVVCLFTFCSAVKEAVQTNLWAYLSSFIIFVVVAITLNCCKSFSHRHPWNIVGLVSSECSSMTPQMLEFLHNLVTVKGICFIIHTKKTWIKNSERETCCGVVWSRTEQWKWKTWGYWHILHREVTFFGCNLKKKIYFLK